MLHVPCDSVSVWPTRNFVAEIVGGALAAGSTTGYSYQWRRCDKSGSSCQSIPGATAQTYTLAVADTVDTIRVVETASNGSGSGTPAASKQTVVVTGTLPPAPHINGTLNGKLGTAKFHFTAKGATGFRCALVLKPTRKGAKLPAPRYVACSATKTFKHLKKGRTYVLYVRSVNNNGTDKTATVETFKIH